jgi:hypothetical protein
VYLVGNLISDKVRIGETIMSKSKNIEVAVKRSLPQPESPWRSAKDPDKWLGI